MGRVNRRYRQDQEEILFLTAPLEHDDVELNRRRSPTHLSPLAGRGRIASAMPTGRANARPMTGSASSGAIRVRGVTARTHVRNLRKQPLTPTLSPRRAGRWRRDRSPLLPQPKLIPL